MDSAIRFKSSRLNGVLYILCLFMACYSIKQADVSALARLIALVGLILLVAISIRQYYRQKGLRGLVRLTSEGLIPIEDSFDRSTRAYKARVLQRLPWCLNVELSDPKGKSRQLVWKDSLSADDWRKFRAYLAELPAQ